MMEFANSLLGLVASAVSIVAGLAALWYQWGRSKPPLPKNVVLPAVGFALLLLGAGIVGFRLAYPLPAVSISSPTGGVDVTADGQSYWFQVSGASSNVASDSSLRIYVLAFSGSDWHVQRPATVASDGQWVLDRAWIGDPSAPIRENSTIRIVAVVSRQQRSQDEKVPTPQELAPVGRNGMSPIINLRVQKVS